MKRFGLKERKDYSKDLLTKDQYRKVRIFKENPEIIIRKADKNNTFVIMNKNEYNHQIDLLLSDVTKFKKIKSDPSNCIKTKLNKLISEANKPSTIMQKIDGHHEPGYIYGNPKIHKNRENPPLRPIISQVGTVTYETAKRLNTIIAKYLPKKFVIESTFEFIQLARATNAPKFLASLDVESLFTQVPLQETIDIIINYVYNHEHLSPPKFPSSTMKNLLKICTTETPFRSLTDMSLYQQIDGVSMGTPLGPTIANY